MPQVSDPVPASADGESTEVQELSGGTVSRSSLKPINPSGVPTACALALPFDYDLMNASRSSLITSAFVVIMP